MRITILDRTLEKLCSNEREQQKQLGSTGAKKLRTRLADIMAARCVTDLVAGRPHPLKGAREGQFAVDLVGGCRLVFEPEEQPPCRRDDGGIAWEKITSVKIVFIGDYHD